MKVYLVNVFVILVYLIIIFNYSLKCIYSIYYIPNFIVMMIQRVIQMREWDNNNVILTGNSDGTVRVCIDVTQCE